MLSNVRMCDAVKRAYVRCCHMCIRVMLLQIGSRAERMGLAGNDNIFLFSATRLQDILAEIISMQPAAVIVDSIQTVYLDDVNGSAGSVSQVDIFITRFLARSACICSTLFLLACYSMETVTITAPPATARELLKCPHFVLCLSSSVYRVLTL